MLKASRRSCRVQLVVMLHAVRRTPLDMPPLRSVQRRWASSSKELARLKFRQWTVAKQRYHRPCHRKRCCQPWGGSRTSLASAMSSAAATSHQLIRHSRPLCPVLPLTCGTLWQTSSRQPPTQQAPTCPIGPGPGEGAAPVRRRLRPHECICHSYC